MVSLKLAKPWLEHAIGDTVEVDPMRAQWLKDNGYEESAGEVRGRVVKPPRVGPGDHELRPLVPELSSPSDSLRSPRKLKIQPQILPLAVTETQIKDAGEGPAMVEEHIRQTLNKPVSED